MDAAMGSLSAASLSAWTPVHVRTRGGAPAVDWALVGEPSSDPFFEQTVHRAMQHPFNAVFGLHTPVGALETLRERSPGAEPAGFVFHMSRCGSTVISQMLSGLSSSIVLSEPQPVDALLRLRGRARSPHDEETLAGWLRAMVSALAQPRAGETRAFVKFHAWHVLELPFIARAFPGVPWAFVFREPRAVLRSQEKMPGAEVVAGTIDPAYLELTPEAAYTTAPAEYAARAIAAFCEAALRHAGTGRALFIDYDRLPDAVFDELLPFFGIAPSHADVERMRDVARLDAKGAGRTFQRIRDAHAAAAQPAAAPPASDELASRWLDAPYAALKRRASLAT